MQTHSKPSFVQNGLSLHQSSRSVRAVEIQSFYNIITPADI